MFKKWLTPMCNLKTEPWDVGSQGSCKFSVRTVWVSVQSLNHVWLFVTPQTIACQASLSITNSWNFLKLMSIESVMPSNHLILCHLPLFLPSIFPRIRIFSNELALDISSVQFHCWVMSNSLWPHGLQHARLLCPLPAPGACSNSCPSSQWCHPTISSSVIPFSSCLQSFLASESFQMSQFFASSGQSIGV